MRLVGCLRDELEWYEVKRRGCVRFGEVIRIEKWDMAHLSELEF